MMSLSVVALTLPMLALAAPWNQLAPRVLNPKVVFNPKSTAPVTCQKTVDCRRSLLPANSHHYCDQSTNVCSWVCNQNYAVAGSGCTRVITTSASSSSSAPPSSSSTRSTTTTTPARTSTSTSAAPTPSPSTALELSGVTEFLGVNTGIGSWFRTDNSGDSTNGHSWCGYPYDNNLPGFAPAVDTMLANFDWDYEAAGTAYCGLEAKMTAPNGNTEILYIADGFAQEWVRTPGSVDIITGSFATLFGKTTTNKNDVIQGLKWEFTGNRNDKYKFKGVGSG